MARLLTIQLIVSEEKMSGSGKENDPYRRITQWFSTDGNLLVEYDPTKDEAVFSIIEFLKKQ